VIRKFIIIISIFSFDGFVRIRKNHRVRGNEMIAINRTWILFLVVVFLLFYGFLYLYQLPLLISSNEDLHVWIGLGTLLLSIALPVLLWIWKGKIFNVVGTTNDSK